MRENNESDRMDTQNGTGDMDVLAQDVSKEGKSMLKPLAFILGGLALVGVIGYFVAHTIAKGRVAEQMAEIRSYLDANAGVVVETGSVDVKLFSGEFAVNDITFEGPEGEAIAARIDKMLVRSFKKGSNSKLPVSLDIDFLGVTFGDLEAMVYMFTGVEIPPVVFNISYAYNYDEKADIVDVYKYRISSPSYATIDIKAKYYGLKELFATLHDGNIYEYMDALASEVDVLSIDFALTDDGFLDTMFELLAGAYGEEPSAANEMREEIIEDLRKELENEYGSDFAKEFASALIEYLNNPQNLKISFEADEGVSVTVVELLSFLTGGADAGYGSYSITVNE